MGTHCITKVKSEIADDVYVTLYRHCDGYPSVHGKELFKFLNGFTIVDGIGRAATHPPKIANGPGCLAAQMVAHFKTEVGQFYLGSYSNETYTYEISLDNSSNLKIKVFNYINHEMFSGDVESFGKFCENCD